MSSTSRQTLSKAGSRQPRQTRTYFTFEARVPKLNIICKISGISRTRCAADLQLDEDAGCTCDMMMAEIGVLTVGASGRMSHLRDVYCLSRLSIGSTAPLSSLCFDTIVAFLFNPPLFLLCVCDVDPARHCVELREDNGQNKRYHTVAFREMSLGNFMRST
jgi:hypothetical protein